MVKLHKPIVYQWIAKEVLKKICSPKENMKLANSLTTHYQPKIRCIANNFLFSYHGYKRTITFKFHTSVVVKLAAPKQGLDGKIMYQLVVLQ
jgi:hypothetical protein